jgi:2-oxo-4-hydroxy-4-carboxy-5-ureidoimidazoline decarboxylase
VSAGDAVLRALLGRCCAARRWVAAMIASAPWRDREALERACDAAFDTLERDDWLEAFAGHPRIGDLGALRARFASHGGEPLSTRGRGVGDLHALRLAASEQAGAARASEATLRALAEGNARYQARFGYIFIVFASGRSADEMLGLLEERLANDPDDELWIAAGEQRRITSKRLAEAAGDLLAASRRRPAGEEVP